LATSSVPCRAFARLISSTMSLVSELEVKTGVTAQSRTLDIAFVLVTACPTCAFAFWTVATHFAVAAHLSFEWLMRIGPFALLAGIACGMFAARTSNVDANPQVAASPQPHTSWKCLAFATALVLLLALGVGYSAFWIGSVLLLISAMARIGRRREFPRVSPAPLTPRRALALIVLALTSAAVTYVAHRPNVDDAIYVGTATDAIAHPGLPVLSHDVLYGVRNLAPMLPSYAVESYELLIAFLARLFGGEPIFWAHAILPTLVAAILPFAWASLMRMLVPRRWVAATAVSLVVLSLPGVSIGIGNFAFVTLFYGKAILVSAGIPLLYAFAWNFEETGSMRDCLLMLCCTIACVGLSSTAIFVAPVALGTAALAGWREGLTRRSVLTLIPAAYPLSCGIAVRGGFKALEPVFAHLPVRAHLAVSLIFGEHAQYIFLFALLASPFLVRERVVRWKLMVVALVSLLVPLNPFIFKLLSRLTTREVVWRILWSVPIVAMVAGAMVNAIDRASERWGNRGRAVAGFAVLCIFAYLSQYSSFAPSNGVSFSLAPLKVRVRDWETARAAIAATPSPAALLAPEDVAVWVPTFVHRPLLISVREFYDQHTGVQMPPEEATDRRELRELVSGLEFPRQREQELLNALARYQVGLILTTATTAIRLQDVLAERGYSRTREKNGFVFFALATK
jgi:hypothetical protein